MRKRDATQRFQGEEVAPIFDMIMFRFAYEQITNRMSLKDYEQVEAMVSLMREMVLHDTPKHNKKTQPLQTPSKQHSFYTLLYLLISII
jgi:hypothetical protein